MTDIKDLIPVRYQDQNEVFQGLVTPNHGNGFPAILILPAWMGIDKEAIQAACDLQSKGYVAMIADIYGQDYQPKSTQEAALISKSFKDNYDEYQGRISLALQELKRLTNTDHIAVMGFCFGGAGALEAVRGQLDIKAAICIHGSLYKVPTRETVISHVKVLVQHAANDQFISQKEVENLILEMKESQVDWQLITYGDVKHSFTNPWGEDYNKLMAERAWKHIFQFLDEVLK